MNGKPLIQSKEAWVLGLTFVLAFLALPDFISVVPMSWLPYITLGGSFITLVIRTFFTKSEITSFL
jgi:hypothetical protein